jgi:leucyl aminopeptidase
MNVTFTPLDLPERGVVAVGVLEERVLSASARLIDERLEGTITRALQNGRFRGKKDQTLSIVAPSRSELSRVLLLGLGKPADIDALQAQRAGATLYSALAASGEREAVVMVDAPDGCRLTPGQLAAEMAFGASLRSYRFDKYLTKEGDDDKPNLDSLVFASAEPEQATLLFRPKGAVAGAISRTRDLVSEPANVIYPESLAAQAKTLAELGVEVEVLGKAQMRELGMGALLGVAQGSEREPQLVVMQWWGAGKPAGALASATPPATPPATGSGSTGPDEKPEADENGPIAFVGKGVTFDSGGISIKPSGNMEEMKYDMAGAAAVIGTLRALAARGAKANVVGIIGLVENMPSGTAQRPGDVVKSMSGQTIEVINTDAEGRLVLSDALWYCKQRFRPRLMIDLATLTGAIIIALGNEYAGLFSNNDELASRLAKSGEAVHEPLWRMPLGDAYDKIIKSDIADMKNVGNRGAGSITAAQFLQRFVGKTPWAHLDIAGMAWTKTDRDVTPKGASGFGVRLLDRFVADYYEQG